MPLYDYECPNGHRQEELRSIKDRHNSLKCKVCKKKMHLIVSNVVVDPWKPIIIEHIEPNGKPRLFKTRQELRKRCNELGVESSALL